MGDGGTRDQRMPRGKLPHFFEIYSSVSSSKRLVKSRFLRLTVLAFLDFHLGSLQFLLIVPAIGAVQVRAFLLLLQEISEFGNVPSIRPVK